MKQENNLLTNKAVAAMKAAVRNVVEDHRRRGRPLATWANGKVVYRHPENGQIVSEGSSSYGESEDSE